MPSTICILGRQPSIGRAELEAVYGSEAVRVVSDAIVELSVKPTQFSISRLGGTQKSVRTLAMLDTQKWSDLIGYALKTLPSLLTPLPEGKVRLGISVYNLPINVRDINAATLKLKKATTQQGRSARAVPNKATELNSAQVLHNQLTGPTGLELIFIRDGHKTIVGQAIAVQDISAYARRDQERPKRDARVGMLPPKLAQIIINLAAGELCEGTILDPFCGTGVILQEALLDGFNVYGTDLEARMIDYSRANVTWLEERSRHPGNFTLEKADASRAKWQAAQFDVIASETYLGKPLSSLPTPSELAKVVGPVDQLHRQTLVNIASQTKKGFRLCLAVPAWRQRNSFIHLPCLDDLSDMGYTRLKFAHAAEDELIYFRDDQFVARELVTLIRT